MKIARTNIRGLFTGIVLGVTVLQVIAKYCPSCGPKQDEIDCYQKVHFVSPKETCEGSGSTKQCDGTGVYFSLTYIAYYNTGTCASPIWVYLQSGIRGPYEGCRTSTYDC